MSVDTTETGSPAPQSRGRWRPATPSRMAPASPASVDLVDLPAVLRAPVESPSATPAETSSIDAYCWRAKARALRWSGVGVSRKGYLLAAGMLWPARVAIESLKQVARHGASVKRAQSMPIARQLLDQLAIAYRFGIRPTSYYKLKLHLPQRRAQAGQFICEPEALAVLRAASHGPELALLDDKRAFAEACAARGLPHVENVAVFVDGKLVARSGSSAQNDGAAVLPRSDLFVKSTGLLCGRGIEAWKWNAHDDTYESKGSRLTPTDLVSRLCTMSQSQPAGSSGGARVHNAQGKVATPTPFIVQKRVENHPALASYSASGAICTLRVVTARRRGTSESPRFIVGVLRMPAGGSAVDNFAAGGIAAPIDADTGVLGIAIAKDLSRPSMREHPDSGTPITGETVPMWAEAKALALRAHAMFPDTPTVGWDVAMTPAGPVLLEANPVWCVELAQMTHGRPLGKTMLPEIVLGTLGDKESGSESGARLWRRLYFRARWKANHAPIRRAKLIARQILWPILAAISSVMHACYSGVAARKDGAPIIPLQLLASWWIAMRYRVWPAGYYRYRFHDPKRRALAREFIDEQEGIELLQSITRSGERWLLDDKRRFADACARFDIPHAQAVECFENGNRVNAARDQQLVLPADDLFIKSASLFSGAGIEQWKWRADEDCYEHDGKHLAAAALLSHVIERSKIGHNGNAGRTVLIQKRLRNHERLAVYSPGGALCTVRIITARPKGGVPEFIEAALRMPSTACDIDNFGAGGLAAPIDASTGTLGPALKLYLEMVDVTSHPLTGAAIDGNVIPFWQECRALCLSAHEKFPTVFSVGWDVAVTPDGPLLLEANPIWGIEVTQMAHGKPLGLTRLPELVRTWVEG